MANPEPPCVPDSCKQYPSLPFRAGSPRWPGDHRQCRPSVPLPAPGNSPATDVQRLVSPRSRAQSTREGKGDWILSLVLGALQKSCSLAGLFPWAPPNRTYVHGAARVVPKHPRLGWCRETHFPARAFKARPLRLSAGGPGRRPPSSASAPSCSAGRFSQREKGLTWDRCER